MGAKVRSEGVRAQLARRRLGLEARVAQAIHEAAAIALEVGRSLAPGKVGQTLQARVTRGFVAGVRVTSTWDKVRFVENDTRAHVIEPKSGSVLAFVANGSMRFARRVNHPGTKGTHFMARAREAGRLALKRLLADAINPP